MGSGLGGKELMIVLDIHVRHQHHEAGAIAHHRFDAIVVKAFAVEFGCIGGAERAKLGLGVGQVSRAARQDVPVIGRAVGFGAFIMRFVAAVIPGDARAGVAVVADEGAPRTVGLALRCERWKT